MKNSLLLLAIVFALQGRGQTANSASNQGSYPQDTPYSVVQRDANSCTWVRTNYAELPTGEIVSRVHRYQELATGLNFKNPQTGEWIPSSEEIDILPDGSAAATNGQHQAYFPGDIYQGVIELITPDGKHLQSQPLGLSYFDGTNSVLIAELTNSVGLVVGDNQVIYPNAFTGIKADLLYEYTKAGFEQDVILREQPPDPRSFGLNPQTTRLQVLTEFFNPPQPAVTEKTLPNQAGVALSDQTLDFGALGMIQGRTWLFGNSALDESALVGKSWEFVQGRQILVEAVPMMALSKQLAQLPAARAASVKANPSSPLNIVSAKQLLPAQRIAEASVHKLKLASIDVQKQPGLVLDYQTVSGSLTNYTFQSDTTYYISGTLDLYGTNNVFEGGAVVKYAVGASIVLVPSGTPEVKFQSAAYRPVIFTGQDDNSVGDAISGSTGAPTNYYANPALSVPDDGSQTVHDLKICFAQQAIYTPATSLVISNAQFVNCQDGVYITAQPVYLRNALFSNVETNFNSLSVATVEAENVTFGDSAFLATTNSPSTSVILTNCVLANVTNLGLSIVGGHNGFYNSPPFGTTQITNTFYPFQTVGAGSYYFASGCTYTNRGATNIDSALLMELAKKTVYAPIVYSNVFFSNDVTFDPQVQRDGDTPDLGYHYDPVDYLVHSCWITNATLVLDPGTAVASDNDSGFAITDGGTIISWGTATAPNWFARYSVVQEQPIALGQDVNPNNAETVNSYHTNSLPNGIFRFSKFSCPAGGGYHLVDPEYWAYSNLLVEDCEFWSGTCDFTGNNSTSTILRNNLFARCAFQAFAQEFFSCTNNLLSCSNNLFWNSSFSINADSNTNTWLFFNNEFYNSPVRAARGRPQVASNGYNAYIGDTNRLFPTNANDIVTTNTFAFISGPLGDFYQPTNSMLRDVGSVTADLAELYYFTTTTNQVEETNSIVDIGYHYAVLNTGSVFASILSPADNELFVISPTNILLTGWASSSDTYVSTVAFYAGSTWLGNATNAGDGTYSLLWKNVAAGTYSLTMRATNSLGEFGVSSPVSVIVNSMPSVSIVAPTNLESFSEVTNVQLKAIASDAEDGTNVSVSFYFTNSLIGSAVHVGGTTNSFVWDSRARGAYSVVAVVTDSQGASIASSPTVFTVKPTNAYPSVSITYPTDGNTFVPGSDITITATATNYPASVTNVEFFVNGQSIGSVTNAPYSIDKCCWDSGTYEIIAVARDSLGMASDSLPITITIGGKLPAGQGYWDPDFQMPSWDGWQYEVDNVLALKVTGNGLYIGGEFYYSLDDETGSNLVYGQNIINWDGTNWNLMGRFPSGTYNIATYGPNVYASTYGPLSCDTHICAQGAAVWDGGNNNLMEPANWIQMGTNGGEGSYECPMTVVGSDVYAGFNPYDFHTVPPANNLFYVAKWNPATTNWEMVGDFLNGPVYALGSLGGHLFVGGAFTSASSNLNANYIAELDGNVWTNLGTGLFGPHGVEAVDESDAGEYETNAVRTLAACGTNLFVGGGFIGAGGNTNANGIAIWNGTEWRTIAYGLDGGTNADGSPNLAVVRTITPRGNTVFVGGEFVGAKDDPRHTVPASAIAVANWDEDAQQWTWSDLDLGVSGGDAANPYSAIGYHHDSVVLASAVVEGQTPNSYDLIVGGIFNEAGSDGISTSMIARWRVGTPYPTNIPTISILSPSNNLVFTNPVSISLVATAAVTDVSQGMSSVEFRLNGASVQTVSATDGNGDYSFTWDTNASPPLAPGLYTLTATATATDLERYWVTYKHTSKPMFFKVVDTNQYQGVVASNDVFTIFANSGSVELPVLTNDYPSSGLNISQVGQSPTAFGGYGTGTASISKDAKYVLFTPTPFTFGTNYLWYSITNSSGASDQAPATVFVRVPPVVQILSPDCSSCAYTSPISSLTISGTAYDWDGIVTNLSFFTNGVLCSTVVPTGTNFSFNWSASAPGFYKLQVIAVDNDGYTNGSSGESITGSSIDIDVKTSSLGDHPPVAIINTPLGTTNVIGDSSVTWIHDGQLTVTGSAYDPDGDPVSYQILLLDPNHPDNPPLYNVTAGPLDADGFHSGAVTNASLGTNDLSLVENGSYLLELLVRGGGAETATTIPVGVDSQLKVGQFSFSEQDLVLPVNGIPITVTRTYNSLNPRPGPFGYSWSFALNDMDVQMDEQRDSVTIGSDNAPYSDEDDSGSDLPQTLSVRTGGGWDVTLTLPDGRRVTFPFTPYYANLSEKVYAAWSSPPGVTATLTADSDADVIDFFPSPHWEDSDLTWGEAPIEYHDIKGWILQMQDGTKYHITRGNGVHVAFDPDGSGTPVDALVYGPPKLTEIDQLSTNKIVINTNGIFNYDPTNALTRWALFDYDGQGRIVALRDPNSGSNGIPVVKYVYNNDTGNLIQVLKLVDRNAGTYTTNKYHYDNVRFPHYITSIENGDNIPVARNFYDDSGRLKSVQDANGTLTQFNHSLTNNSEVVIDRLQHTNVYVYDLQGNVIWETNALGQVTATAYTNSNFPALKTAETNAYGTAQATWTLYQYDSAGNQTNVISMGHTNSFAYDGAGNLLTQTDPLGNITQNLYDDAGNLTNTAQYDATGHLVQQSSSVYENGKLMETLNGSNQVTATFSYDEFGNLTNTTDANGFSRGFSYDANGNQTGSSYTWTPPGGSPTNVTTTTTYDAQNRVVQTVDALGNTNSTFYNALGKVDYTVDKFGGTNGFVYDALGNLIQTTYPNGTSTRTVYDAAGRAYLTMDRNGVTGMRTDYDAEGRATNTVRLTNVVINITYSGSVAESSVISAGVPISTNSTVYDAAGRVKLRTSPDGTTTYDYYPDGQLMDVVDALTNTTVYAYDAAGRQTNVVDALSHSTKFQYDAVGRMVATIYDNNTATTNIFDNLGQRTGVVDQAKLITQFGYSLSGQLTNVIKPAVPDPENGGTPNPTWSYLYDSNGLPTVTIDPKGRGTTNFFDAFNRQFSQRLTMNQTNLVEYNSLGQVVTNFDFKGQWTKFAYDQFGRMKAKFFFTSDNHLSNSVCYQYNDLDEVTNITERYGDDAATNSCDGYLALVGPSGGQPAVDSKASRIWVVITTTAPKWGAPLAALAILYLLLSLPTGRRLREILAWYYLRGGWRLGDVATTRDRRTKRLRLPSLFWRMITILTAMALIVDDPGWDNLSTARADCSYPMNESTLTTRITSYVYDFDGRVTQVNSPEGVINYDYDLATGRLLSTCTTNSYVTNSYDALGRLKTVTVLKRNGTTLPTPEVTTNSYDKVGNRSEEDLPNGIVTKYLYDDLNRLTNMTHFWGSTNLATYRYTLDATGRRTNAVEILRIPSDEGDGYFTNTLTWQFDGMYRLTNEVNLCSVAGASYTNAYVYDLVGNRFFHTVAASNSLVVITNSYDANDELLVEVTKTGSLYTQTNTYEYDPNGSMIGLTNSASTGLSTNVYTYDLRNKLSTVTSGTSTTGFQYNDQGIRVRTTGASTKYYLIDANNHTGYQQVLEEFSSLGTTPTRSYVIGDDVLAQADGGSASYLLHDGHGSTRQIADNNASVTSRYSYDGYGNVPDYTSSPIDESTRTSMLYCGEQYDSALQMYNLRARYYSPSNGRFNARDTFEGSNEDPMSLHKYTYLNCDPINDRDPSGQAGLVEQLLAISIIFIGLTLNTISLVNHLAAHNYKAVPWDVLGILLALAGAKGGGNGLTYAPASGSTLIPFASNFSTGARLTLAGGSSIIGGVDLMMQSGHVDHPQFSSPPPSEGPFPNQMPDQLNDELAWVDRAGIVPAEPGTAKFWEVLQENPVVKWAVTKDGKFGIVPYKVKIGGVFREVPHTAITRGADAWAGEASLRGDTLYLNKLSGHYTPQTYSPGEVAFGNTGLKVKYVSGSLVP